jgi:hypothetical protein
LDVRLWAKWKRKTKVVWTWGMDYGF